jgi:hypothetical protein
MKNVIKSSENPLPDEISSNKEHSADYTSITNIGNEQDNSEHFEFEIFRVLKIKSKRITKNVIIVIVFVLLSILAAWLIAKR